MGAIALAGFSIGDLIHSALFAHLDDQRWLVYLLGASIGLLSCAVLWRLRCIPEQYIPEHRKNSASLLAEDTDDSTTSGAPADLSSDAADIELSAV